MHDVVVIGGGIAGTLAVLAAADRGLDVAWVADSVGPDAQSAHWHGHLHRGRLYDPVREAELVGEIGENVPFWWSSPVVRFHTPLATVALGLEKAWATDFHRQFGGSVGNRSQSTPAYAKAGVYSVTTDEAVLDGPAFLSTARDLASSNGRLHRGCCIELVQRPDGTWQAIGRGPAGDLAVVRARMVILATGTRASELLPPSVRIQPKPGLRLARMLVLRGPLPPAAAIIPSRAAGGLFFDSREMPGRTDGAERVWLVSDGFSSPGTTSPGQLTDAWWACSVLERLGMFVRRDLLKRSVVGAYRAPKSRVESSPTQVPATGFGIDPERRFVSLMPSKWTTAPSSAVAALHALVPDPLPASARLLRVTDRFEARQQEGAARFPETWETVRAWVPVADLLKPGMSALRSAARIFPDVAGDSRSAVA